MEEVAMTRQMTVGDVMTHEVVQVREDTPYRAIVDALMERRISAVPVVGEAYRVVGVVSEADLLHRVEFLGEEHERRVFERPSRHEARAKSHGLSARDLMTSPAVTVTANTPVARAAKIMASAKVKRLPVVDASGALVGIVARSDLLAMYMRPDWAVREDVVTGVVRGVMWLDPEAVGVEVVDGVVTLTGTVDRRSTAAILRRLAESVPGVIEVVGRLTWTHDDTDDAGSRFFRSPPFSSSTEQPQ
jgi:CBS domain-containing protein